MPVDSFVAVEKGESVVGHTMVPFSKLVIAKQRNVWSALEGMCCFACNAIPPAKNKMNPVPAPVSEILKARCRLHRNQNEQQNNDLNIAIKDLK